MKFERSSYDTIIVFETDFQKTIVDMIFQNANDRILIIDARSYMIRMNGVKYRINLNGFKNTVKSICDLLSFPRLHTKELVCTAFTGINSRLFPAIIEHEHLSLIDDGSGTPAILKSGKYPWNKKYRIRFVFSLLVLAMLRGRFLSRTKTLINEVETYYSIYYKFVDSEYSKYTKKLKIIRVDYFSKYKFDNVLKGTVGYISNGCVHVKNERLQKIFKETGHKPVYYPHPYENLKNIDKNYIERIERPNCILEDFFMQKGIPEVLFGDPSTVFINLRMSDVPANNMTIFYTNRLMNRTYYEIFKGLEINIINEE